MKRFILVWGLLWAVSPLLAQENQLDREFEPIVLWMESFTEIYDAPADEFFLYRFDNSDSTWHQIPFQYDEVSDSTGSYFDPDNGLVDPNDELVFMAKDAGDRAPEDRWLMEQGALDNPRFEIQVTDGAHPDEAGWVYLYRSETLEIEFTEDYVSYDAGTDVFSSEYLTIGFANGPTLEDLAITEAGGGTGTDMIDRVKFRMRGAIAILPPPFPPFEYEVTEDQIEVTSIQVVDGPIRVIRQAQGQIEIADDFPMDFDMEFIIYERYLGQADDAIDVDPAEIGLEHLRVSVDFNENQIGSWMHLSSHADSVLIDGEPDDPEVDIPDGSGYALGSSNQGSLMQLFQFDSGLGNVDFYYYDNANGGTGDGSVDTGDGASYGDTGIQVSQFGTGTFGLGTQFYALPANQSPAVAEMYMENLLNPIILTITRQETDIVAVEPEIASLTVPSQVILYQNVPNPFNPKTTIQYDIAQAGEVSLTIYDIAGRLVRQWTLSNQPAGSYHLIWDGTNSQGQAMSSGLYIYRLETPHHARSKTMMLLR